ncbi:MAG TPA: glycerophosphodiester phosphodiesterase family protein [Candidatus Lokiarchaeia archaeon]|nr:glycerophosphodiester phosphodiesterase family protein [Candidatus Lokiarchaeia archaeon]
MLIFAHRGGQGHAPANTLKAFDLAVNAGTSALESDVRATVDGNLVFFHDAIVSLGMGRKLPVFLVPYKRLQLINAGAGERIPRVKDVFKHYADQGKLEAMTWSIDVPGIQPSFSIEFDHLVKICEAFVISKNVLACSTGCKILLHWRRKSPVMTYVWSVRPEQLRKMAVSGVINACKACQADVLNIKLEDATSELVDAARAKDLQVFLWDVHDRARYERAIQFNPDAIYTDYPLEATNGTWST